MGPLRSVSPVSASCQWFSKSSPPDPTSVAWEFSSHGPADFEGGALWSPDQERSSPFFRANMMSRGVYAP